MMMKTSDRQPKQMSTLKTLMFSVHDRIGILSETLQIIKDHKINVNKIESRPSITSEYDYDFILGLISDEDEVIHDMIKKMEEHGIKNIKFLSSSSSKDDDTIPWFPRRIKDLDLFNDRCLQLGEELDADHPGANDAEYRKRRIEIANIAKEYKHGQPIPRVEYTDQEKQVWKTVYTKLKELTSKYACKQYNQVFPLLEQNCGYSEDNIPQLEDISNYLQQCTGWRIRPVTGLLSSRDFLNGLAFRVFHSTQYIRHHASPLYTPEPDICHELLGHVPLFADPEFADFSQEIGLASLGASDEDIKKLATCYWFTVEFGICKEGDQLKAYGAGLLSSYGELEYSMTDKPKLLPFDPKVTANTDYPVTTYQPLYFVTESFEDAKKKMIEFSLSLKKKFTLRYNPYTQSVEVLDTKDKLHLYSKSIRDDIARLTEAIQNINL